MRIIGIDPGSRLTGFGVIEIENKSIRYITSGCIKVPTDEDLYIRLRVIFKSIKALLEEYQPEQGAIEQVFMAQNAGSALKLGQARGAAIVAMADFGLFVGEYSARQVKQAVVGYGAADKLQVQHMVKTLLNLSKTPQADAADALAVALCHHHSEDNLLKLGGAKKIVHGRLI